MSREIRRVPENWEHPKENGRFVAMYQWREDHVCNCDSCELNDNLVPKGPWYQLFEGVSEGTPLSPPFATKDELKKWLTDNKDYWGTQWSKKGAEDIVETGYAPSGILSGSKIYKPEEQYMLSPNA